MTINTYRDLIVWQKGIVLAADVLKMARAMPYRDYQGIGSQMQRAAVSIPSNVAEGWARGQGRAYPFHVRIALGSEAELQTDLEIAVLAGSLTMSDARALQAQTAEVGRLLHGLHGALTPSNRSRWR